MNRNGIDVESLPELKISAESFEALAEINGEEVPDVKNGATWKRRIDLSDGAYATVICRYRSYEIGGPITIEILRPAVTGPIGNTRDGYKRKSR